MRLCFYEVLCIDSFNKTTGIGDLHTIIVNLYANSAQSSIIPMTERIDQSFPERSFVKIRN